MNEYICIMYNEKDKIDNISITFSNYASALNYAESYIPYFYNYSMVIYEINSDTKEMTLVGVVK